VARVHKWGDGRDGGVGGCEGVRGPPVGNRGGWRVGGGWRGILGDLWVVGVLGGRWCWWVTW